MRQCIAYAKWITLTNRRRSDGTLIAGRHGISDLCDGSSWRCITKCDTLSWFDLARLSILDELEANQIWNGWANQERVAEMSTVFLSRVIAVSLSSTYEMKKQLWQMILNVSDSSKVQSTPSSELSSTTIHMSLSSMSSNMAASASSRASSINGLDSEPITTTLATSFVTFESGTTSYETLLFSSSLRSRLCLDLLCTRSESWHFLECSRLNYSTTTKATVTKFTFFCKAISLPTMPKKWAFYLYRLLRHSTWTASHKKAKFFFSMVSFHFIRSRLT